MGSCHVCASPDSLYRWQIQVSVYCDWWIPAILGAPSVQSRYTLGIPASYRVFVYGRYFQIQACLCVVVGPGFVST